MMNKNNDHVGSSFDNFLSEEGILDEVEKTASDRLASFDLAESISHDQMVSRYCDEVIPVAIYEAAVKLFDGNQHNAVRWLNEPARALGGITPLECLSIESGPVEVLDLIGRLEHGIYS